MLYWVVVYLIDVCGEVGFVPNQMLPKPSLPDAAFAAVLRDCALHTVTNAKTVTVTSAETTLVGCSGKALSYVFASHFMHLLRFTGFEGASAPVRFNARFAAYVLSAYFVSEYVVESWSSRSFR